MKSKIITMLASLLFIGMQVCPGVTKSKYDILTRPLDLSGTRTNATQFYSMESQLLNFTLDGTLAGTDIFRLRLKWIPAAQSKAKQDELICLSFTVQLAGAGEIAIPVLQNHTFNFASGYDSTGQVFGIDHTLFDGLVDANGAPLPPDKAYHVYNAFIDFLGFCNVLAEPTPAGTGIQDLKQMGDKIVHAAAFTEPPVNLGSQVSEGSTFKNGEMTLALTSLSMVNNHPCALVHYDSGQSSFCMKMQPMPDFNISTVGSSHYFGDIYKSLENNWVQQVTLGELVISETTLPMPPNKINAVMERKILIRNVQADEFPSHEKL